MKAKSAMRAIGLLALTLGAVALYAQPQRRQEPAVRLPARGTRGAVGGGTEYATEAGMRMFFSGGNAVDAGVATMYAASVVEFSHFGLHAFVNPQTVWIQSL